MEPRFVRLAALRGYNDHPSVRVTLRRSNRLGAWNGGRVAPSAIDVRGLAHRYSSPDGQGLVALEGIDLTVGAGQFVALVGPSGCGKTTLLRAVGGLLRAERGEVQVLGGTAAAARRAHAIGLVAQDPGLLPWRSVEDNVRLTLQLTGERTDAHGRAHGALERVGLGEFGAFRPRELSGGMRQRVALARALVHAPQLLLMDEPFGALDELSREDLCVELLRVWERERVSVLFVTHSIREAVLLSDRVVVMSPAPGRIVADIAIALPRPRDPRADDSPEFAAYVHEIRMALGRVPAGVH